MTLNLGSRMSSLTRNNFTSYSSIWTKILSTTWNCLIRTSTSSPTKSRSFYIKCSPELQIAIWKGSFIGISSQPIYWSIAMVNYVLIFRQPQNWRFRSCQNVLLASSSLLSTSCHALVSSPWNFAWLLRVLNSHWYLGNWMHFRINGNQKGSVPRRQRYRSTLSHFPYSGNTRWDSLARCD